MRPSTSTDNQADVHDTGGYNSSPHEQVGPAFAHLHTHSSWSPMEGVASLLALCAAARAQGGSFLALTDTNGLYAAVRFLETARQHGLRPILGAELVTTIHRAVLLAATPTGYANLCRILSARHQDPDFDAIDTVAHHRDGLIVLSDDEPALTAWARVSREHLFVELTSGPTFDMDRIRRLGRSLGLPPVATTRARFLRAEDFGIHRVLRAIAHNTTLSRLSPTACCASTQWLQSPTHLAGQYPHCPEALENSLRIAESCHTDWRFDETIFPAFRRLSSDAAFDLLQTRAYEGARLRYGEITPTIRTRLTHELRIIREKRFADYFLVVDEIVRQAPRTCGRGSVAASLVSYCLQITHVDPLRHNLFFERFLNPGRRDPPDIDIDFPWDERETILEWVFTQYGRSQAAMVANQNSLGWRAALREVAKVYGMPPAEIARVSTRVSRQQDFVEFTTPPTAAEWATRLTQALRLPAPWREIFERAAQVEGHFRTLGLHCGGVVIVPDDIRRYVPVQISASRRPVIQWDKDQTEDAGLVKIDLLGNRSLAVIRDALAAIARHTGRQIDYALWDPLDDPATQALIRCGDTIGCFYVESPATRLLLRKLWGGMPADRAETLDVFEALVIVSSLVRPAANRFVDEFIRRAHGAPYAPWHPRLTPILAETYGIMVYQEDVTKVAMALADFSVEDADHLRKVLSKKHKAKQLQDYRDHFCLGAARNGASPDTIITLWQMILSFAGYSFCKPHSASYAQVSFKSAYLRAHHPAEFLAAVINNRGGFYSTYAYLSEARRIGLTIAPPDVNASDWAYIGKDRTLRIGFMQLIGLPRAVVDGLIEERTRGGPFRSWRDFQTRVPLERRHARLLIRAGACDTIAGELTRPALLWRLYAGTRADAINLPIPPEYSVAVRIQHEQATLGFIASCHPLDLYTTQIARFQPSPIAGTMLGAYVGRHVTMVGVLITEKFAQTKTGQPMEFATFEDRTALYDVTLFPDIYRRYCHLLHTDQGYVLHGRVEAQFGVATLTLTDLTQLQHNLNERTARGSG
ncbi:MAG: DNA polymerase III subunit alpha [Nitrospiraceae bacterium]